MLGGVEFDIADEATVKKAAAALGLKLQTGTHDGKTVSYYAFPVGWNEAEFEGTSNGQVVMRKGMENLDLNLNQIDTDYVSGFVNIIVSDENTDKPTWKIGGELANGDVEPAWGEANGSVEVNSYVFNQT